MPNPGLTDDELKEAVEARAQHSSALAAAESLGWSRGKMENRLREAARRGIHPATPKAKSAPAPAADDVDLAGGILAVIRRRSWSLAELAEKLSTTKGRVLDAIEDLKAAGHMIMLAADRYSISGPANPAFMSAEDDLPTYYSRKDHTFVFGACGDNHLGSKYARLDVLEALYTRYTEEGVDRVFNTGNWVDGEARFNKHDLLVHGMDAQLRYLAKHYPQRSGIETYAVAGDDHEGWYAQGFGIDIGLRAQHTMREAGRTDWHNLGYMESHVRLVNSDSGKSSILAVVHPGGGSAYALSYAIQKIIESLDGGEKPAVGLYGHYHKLWAGNIRNVWCIQTGTTEDQTPFMRKKKLEAHVGGTLVKLRQDPKSGAITECTPTLIRYFNRGFYNNRWNHGDEVTHADRSVAA